MSTREERKARAAARAKALDDDLAAMGHTGGPIGVDLGDALKQKWVLATH